MRGLHYGGTGFTMTGRSQRPRPGLSRPFQSFYDACGSLVAAHCPKAAPTWKLEAWAQVPTAGRI